SCSAFFNLFPDTVPHTYYAVNMASGVPPLSFIWNWGDGSPVDTLPYPSHTYATAGFYTICLTITDSVGCTDTHCTSYYLTRATDAMVYVNVVASLPTGITNPDNNNFFSVFPNPAFSNLSISVKGNSVAAECRIYNMLGEIKLTSAITNQRTDIDISALSAGVYFVEVISENKIGRKKFIRQ
ncbi:MAG TPA: T9SS type A sorting domain-containing protein, partial [Bacteroidia bacterium]|nr:T9SS type A sorting domain-containing protein [Bacteroidia bacterium]